ncbi:MAG: hypothetical protein M1832_004774 [Thelocarpon impressellum]|nr:MAG: hypothetical protein M1832_004774 [Thelocarpon impressellum]
MVAYLGKPPSEFLRLSEREWRGDPPLPPLSLEGSEEMLVGANKEAFLSFMRSMLTWLPEERKTAKELLEDPWLNMADES